MNKTSSLKYLLFGLLVSLAGTLAAATTTVPFRFVAGQKARASEVNANFDAVTTAVDTVTTAVETVDSAVDAVAATVDAIDGRVSTLEQQGGTPQPERITVTPVDAAVGSTVTLAGQTFTMVQFEVPRYDTGDVYLVKYPSRSDFTTDTSDFISVRGLYPDNQEGLGAGNRLVTTVSGFDVSLYEFFNFLSRLQTTNAAGRSVTNSFSQGIAVNLLLGPQTHVSVSLHIDLPQSVGSSPTKSADAAGLAPVFPPVRSPAERAALRQQLRELVGYISVQVKP